MNVVFSNGETGETIEIEKLNVEMKLRPNFRNSRSVDFFFTKEKIGFLITKKDLMLKIFHENKYTFKIHPRFYQNKKIKLIFLDAEVQYTRRVFDILFENWSECISFLEKMDVSMLFFGELRKAMKLILLLEKGGISTHSFPNEPSEIFIGKKVTFSHEGTRYRFYCVRPAVRETTPFDESLEILKRHLIDEYSSLEKKKIEEHHTPEKKLLFFITRKILSRKT